MKKYTIASEHNFDACHYLEGHKAACKNLHGHCWKVRIEVAANEVIENGSSRGMILDFKDLKMEFRRLVDSFDHSTVIEAPVDKVTYTTTNVEIKDNNSDIILQVIENRTVLVPFRPTCENFSKYFYDTLKEMFPEVYAVTVWETEINSCRYVEDVE